MPETRKPSEVLAERVRELRTDRGWSLQDFAERMRGFGVPLHKTTAAKLEHGDRRIAVDELLAIAYGLDVAPVHLFVPPDLERDDLNVEVVPDVAPSPYVLRRWIRGELPLSGQDARRYELNVPFAEWGRHHGARRDRLVGAAEEAARALHEADKASAANALAEVAYLVEQLQREIGAQPGPALELPGEDQEEGER